MVIDKAMLAFKNSGFTLADHFADVSKTIPMPKGAIKSVPDYQLSRYACYLIVQNGDPRKEVIALGQTYFAIQTRRQEVADVFNQLDEDSKRLVVRGDVLHEARSAAQAEHEEPDSHGIKGARVADAPLTAKPPGLRHDIVAGPPGGLVDNTDAMRILGARAPSGSLGHDLLRPLVFRDRGRLPRQEKPGIPQKCPAEIF